MKAYILPEDFFVLFRDQKYWHIFNLFILKYLHIRRHQISFWKLLSTSNPNS